MQFEGLRSRPTIKPQVMMNRKSLRNWELALGPLQVTSLLGLVMGSMVCAFALGYFSGRRNGFDLAREADLTTAMRLPIVESASRDAIQSDEIYAKLNENSIAKITLDSESGKEEPQKLEPIKTIEESPILAKTESTENITAAASAIPPKADSNNPSQDTNIKPKVDTLPVKETESAKSVKKVTVEKKTEPAKTAIEKPATTKIIPSSQSESPKKEALTLNPGWYAQVAAPRKREDAEAVISKLRGSGFQATIETAEIRGQSYYRVLVGPEKSAELSKRLVAQLSRESYVKGTPFVKQVR